MDVGSKKRKNSLPSEGVKAPKKVRFSFVEETEKQTESEPTLSKDAVAAASAPENNLSDLHRSVSAWIQKQSMLTKAVQHTYLNESVEYHEEEVDITLLETPLKVALANCTETVKRKSYKFECEWSKCLYMTGTDRKYFLHVESHAETTIKQQDGSYTCKWDLCDFDTEDGDDFIGHMHYHAYHTKLKVHGASIHMLMKLPSCVNDSRMRNNISNRPLTFRCEWADCDERFNKAMHYFHHVGNHMADQFIPGKKSSHTPIPCQWSLCKLTYTSMAMALRHMKKHTTEREIACYTCGTMLWSRIKYLDHCARQVETSQRKYQCPHCDRSYATKSVLNNHIEYHNKTHGCVLCPHKFGNRGSLADHMIRAHLKQRNFKCQQCDYATYTKHELAHHTRTHEETKIFRCAEFGCNIAFKSEYAIKKHISWHYNLPPPMYACHICNDKRYRQTNLLSKHLLFAHKVERPPGQWRFRYKLDSDGMFKLWSYVEQKQKAGRTKDLAVVPSDGAVSSDANNVIVIRASKRKSKDNRSQQGNTTEQVETANNPDAYTPIKGKPKISSFKSTGLHEFSVELSIEPEPEMEQETKSQSTVAAAAAATVAAKPKDVKDFTVMKRYLRKERT